MKISVVLCTYNGEKYIKEQLDSILSQTYPIDEILVLDDGSTDGTMDIVRKMLENSSIKSEIIQNSVNLGAAGNFMKGIKLAQGDWILTSDQDDVWFEHKVEDFVKLFETQRECVLAFSDAVVTDQSLTVKQESLWNSSEFTTQKRQFMESGQYYKVLFSDNIVTGAAMAVKREFALVCPPMPEGTLHDYWFALCAPQYGKISMLNKSELYYRQHSTNVIGAPEKSLIKKVQRWIRTITMIQEDREKRYKRADGLRTFLLQSEQENIVVMKEVNEWREFCEWRCSLTNKNVGAGIIEILRCYRLGKYRRFVDKKGIVVQDMLSLLV